VGKLLADPNTSVITLKSLGPSITPPATLAWNFHLRTVVLFSDQLPAQDAAVQYEIWAADANGVITRLGSFSAHPGVSVYPIRFDFTLLHVSSFQLFAGPRSAANAPLLVGTID
jgi:hypothetical protein